MKKLIPPHPPLVKGGWGDLKTTFTRTITLPPAYRQVGIQGEGIHLEWGNSSNTYSSGLKLMLLQALLLPLPPYNGQKPSALPLPE